MLLETPVVESPPPPSLFEFRDEITAQTLADCGAERLADTTTSPTFSLQF